VTTDYALERSVIETTVSAPSARKRNSKSAHQMRPRRTVIRTTNRALKGSLIQSWGPLHFDGQRLGGRGWRN
jgi:hypothetical protein